MTNYNLSVNNGYYLTVAIRLCADVSRVCPVSTPLTTTSLAPVPQASRSSASGSFRQRRGSRNPRNARTHSDQQVAQIAASIREFGFTNPVLIDEKDGIIAGHDRVLAAHLLGLDEVPCIVLAHLTSAQRRAYVLADNKLALNAGWDLEMPLGE